MPNMRTEVWNVCERFGGKYEFHADAQKVVCNLRDGSLEYDLESGTLRGEFGAVSFEVTDIQDVKYAHSGVLFVDSRGSRIGLIFDHAVTIYNREPSRIQTVVMAHPDPFWPALRGAHLTVDLD